MRKCMTELNYLLKAKTQCIWVNTFEEAAFIADICELAHSENNNYNVCTYSSTNNLDTYDTHTCNYTRETCSYERLFNNIKESGDNTDLTIRNTIYILKDFHDVVNNAMIKRDFRNIKEYKGNSYAPIIVVSPVTNIPIELEKLFVTFNYDLPSKDEIEIIVNDLITGYIKSNTKANNDYYKIPTDKEKQVIINSLLGLTYNEITSILRRSTIKHQSLDANVISENKIQIIEKSGLLEYKIPTVSLDDIGGNDVLKDWINNLDYTFSDEAKAFGCIKPKGYLSLGVAGTAKTLFAEAIAYKWNQPLLIFSVSKIFDRYIGESEKRIEQAFRIVKSCAPCVLLFDEAEKIFGGHNSSDLDGGTTSRVFASILKFLANDDNDVFVIMTSNDVSKLPPELTRSGRLDTMWYFGLPNNIERKEIFKIHFKKTGHSVSNDIIDEAVKLTENYTGAEIQNIVKQTIWIVFKRYTETKDDTITINDIKDAISKIIPVFKSSREKVAYLEEYAKNRALRTNIDNTSILNSNEEDLIGSILNDIPKLKI